MDPGNDPQDPAVLDVLRQLTQEQEVVDGGIVGLDVGLEHEAIVGHPGPGSGHSSGVCTFAAECAR